MSEYHLESLTPDRWDQVAELICEGTNCWYRNHGMPDIFGSAEHARLFPEVYESLDPGCCLIAVETATGTMAASCFYHPRQTHLSLGIMNVSPQHWGRGLAGQLLQHIIDEGQRRGLPVRLVSSALNLDSYSLYTRFGFVPQQLFQDMMLPEFTDDQWPKDVKRDRIRQASMADLDAICQLDRELTGLDRRQDFAHFLENAKAIWRVSVCEDGAGQVSGVMASINHPGCRMIGPGFSRNQETSLMLILDARLRFGSESPVVLVPASAASLIGRLYALGARNTELHVSQLRGRMPAPSGVSHPTFLPESS